MKKRTYGFSYSVLGGGYIDIEARNKQEAIDIFWDTDELIELTDFKRGIQIEEIEREEDGACFTEDEKETDLQVNEDDEGKVI